MNLDPNKIAETIDHLIKANLKNAAHTFKRGIVTAASNQKCDVQIEGNTVATQGIMCLDHYRPYTGDKVLILSIGESGANLVVIGKLKATPTTTKWIAPTLINGWVNFDAATHQTAGYYRDSLGRVHLKGLLKSGTMPSPAFVLPVGYRPALVEHVGSFSNGSFGGVRIDHGNGQVQLEAGSNAWFSLGGVSFEAKQ